MLVAIPVGFGSVVFVVGVVIGVHAYRADRNFESADESKDPRVLAKDRMDHLAAIAGVLPPRAELRNTAAPLEVRAKKIGFHLVDANYFSQFKGNGAFVPIVDPLWEVSATRKINGVFYRATPFETMRMALERSGEENWDLTLFNKGYRQLFRQGLAEYGYAAVLYPDVEILPHVSGYPEGRVTLERGQMSGWVILLDIGPPAVVGTAHFDAHSSSTVSFGLVGDPQMAAIEQR